MFCELLGLYVFFVSVITLWRGERYASWGVSGSDKSNKTDDPNQSKPKKKTRIFWFGQKTEPNQ
jgi:hypothetical protein